jgi:hypothetical protein
MNYIGEDELTGYGDIGALYQAPDGSLYQTGRLGENDDLGYLAEDELTQMLGIGYLGEIRQGPDGNLYQWVQGVDGLGNPFGFWKRLLRIARGARRFVRRRVRPFLRRALPIAQTIAPFIPGYGPAIATALQTATPILRRVGIAGYDGLGALYQAPDGTIYQMSGVGDELDYLAEDDLQGFDEADELGFLAEDDDLGGLGADDELGYFAEDELQGYDDADELGYLAEEEDLRGLDADDELGYFAEDELQGFDEADELGYPAKDDLQGYGEEENLGEDVDGYVLDKQMRGLEAYVPDAPTGTRMFVQPGQPPEIWKPLW